MKRNNNFNHWIKLQRRYRNVQRRLNETYCKRLKRKLDILARRIESLNRKWHLGIATSLVTAWLAFNPNTAHAQYELPAEVNLSTFDGSYGIQRNGTNTNNYYGYVGNSTVKIVGDLNGDGFDDIVAGTPDATTLPPFLPRLGGFGLIAGGSDLSATASTIPKFGFGPSPGRVVGRFVAGAGDMNGDGFDDLVVTQAGYSSDGDRVWVIFGQPQFFDIVDQTTFMESSMYSSGQAFVLEMPVGNGFGSSVSALGDINNDGYDDIIIGAPSANTYGSAYVIFGKNTDSGTGGSDFWTDVKDLSISPLAAGEGFVIEGGGGSDGESLGFDVAGIGDINSDGFDDFAVSATGTDFYGIPDTGALYVIFGKAGLTSSDAFNPNSITDVADNGIIISFGGGYAEMGKSISPAGDVNGDGFDDFMIGHMNDESVYVVFGKAQGENFTTPLVSTSGSWGGFRVSHTNGNSFGSEVSKAGDMNNDGFHDFMVRDENQVHVIFGQSFGNGDLLDLNVSQDPGTFMLISNGSLKDETVHNINGGGDVNGDGLPDIVVGSNDDDEGSIFVIFGSELITVPTIWNPLPDHFITENEAFNFEVPDNTIFDIGKTITWTAALEGGGSLPTWLTFDGASKTFTGTPLNADKGIINIAVTATDPDDNFVTDVFSIQIIDEKSYPPSLDPTALDGSNGFLVTGETMDGKLGHVVASAGDVNGDGIDDLIIGAYREGASSNGQVHVVFGEEGVFTTPLLPSSLDGTNGFTMTGLSSDDFLGSSVNSAGDFNGDGIDDIIFAAYLSDAGGSNSGQAFVIFGKDTGFSASIDLDNLVSTDGFMINGLAIDDYLGYEGGLAGLGDFNGDGFDDVILSSRSADVSYSDAGSAYIIFGTDVDLGTSFDLSTLNGSNGFVVHGEATSDLLGSGVGPAGDINNDGFDDLIIGAYAADDGGNLSGKAYVIFGTSSALSAVFDLSTLDGLNGFVIPGIAAADDLGGMVNGGGDMNGDGIDDVVLGAYDAFGEDGAAYVIFGNESFSASFDLNTIDGANGFVVKGSDGASKKFGSSIGLGDFNGDGLTDMIIGQYSNSHGDAFVILGTDLGFESELNVADLNGVNGFSMAGSDASGRFGEWVNSAGDINNDGVDDIVVGAPFEDPNATDDGVVYVIFGIPGAVAPIPVADFTQTATEDVAFSVDMNTAFTDINEGEVLSFTAELNGGGALPTWLSLDGNTGVLSGTPLNEDVGAISVDVTATDSDELSATITFELTVENVNDAPVLNAIGDQSGDEQTEITFTASGSDVDDPAQTLTYSLDATSVAAGMTIDSETGIFSWTPDETQDGTHNVTVTVSDGIEEASETITIAVNEVNSTPVLGTIGAQSGDVGSEISFTATASDADIPAQSLTFSVDASLSNLGMSIDPVTGVFSWVTNETHVGSHQVTVAVSDGEEEDSETFTINVEALPLGVDDQIDLSVYPNPASEFIQIQLSSFSEGEVAYQIYNLSGRVEQEGMLSESRSISVSSLCEGVYFLELKTKKIRLKMVRIIKK